MAAHISTGPTIRAGPHSRIGTLRPSRDMISPTAETATATKAMVPSIRHTVWDTRSPLRNIRCRLLMPSPEVSLAVPMASTNTSNGGKVVCRATEPIVRTAEPAAPDFHAARFPIQYPAGNATPMATTKMSRVQGSNAHSSDDTDTPQYDRPRSPVARPLMYSTYRSSSGRSMPR